MSLSGSGLIASAVSGLTNTYGALNIDKTGLTMNNLTTMTPEQFAKMGNANGSFISYLTTNFSSLDKNNDGKISDAELKTMTQNIQAQGLTREQITSLCSNMSGTNSYSTVLEYFDQIDANHDGKVTDAEIKAYQYKAQRQKLDTQLNSVKSSSYSVYYANETEKEPSSIVDSLYPDV